MAYSMLDCAKNFKMKYKTTNCGVCDTLDDEEHRMFMCPKWNYNIDTTPTVGYKFSDIFLPDLHRVKRDRNRSYEMGFE